LNGLWEVAQHLLREDVDDSFDGYVEVLDIWRTCLDTFVKFSEITKFEGDKTARLARLEELAEDIANEAQGMLLETSMKLALWCAKEGFSIEKYCSEGLVRVFMSLGGLEGKMLSLEAKLIRLTGILFAWYD
jgi:hypothetical protein